MAKAPKDPNAPKKPRNMKPRKLFFMFKGDLSEHRVVANSDQALDIKDVDPSWNYVRFEVPKGKRVATDTAA